MQAREEEMERVGSAHRAALEEEERVVREAIEKNEKAIRDKQAAKQRGSEAIRKEKDLLEERKRLEEAIKQIERKKHVGEQER